MQAQYQVRIRNIYKNYFVNLTLTSDLLLKKGHC